MNNKTGRPRNTAGSLFLRRDSRVWWMSYRDHNGRFRQESTGRRTKGEAEKVLRKRLVARDEGLLPECRAGRWDQLQRVGGLVPGEPLSTALPEREDPPATPQRAEVPQVSVRQAQTVGHHAGRDRIVSDDEIEHRQTGVHQIRAATSRPAQTGHRASGASHPEMHPERGGEEAGAWQSIRAAAWSFRSPWRARRASRTI